jgi:hypothetical protein
MRSGTKVSSGLLVLAGVSLPVLATISGQAAAPRTAPSHDINATHDPRYRWGESAIAINPRNPNNLVIASVGTGFTSTCQAKSSECQTIPVELAPGFKFPQPKGMFERPDFNAIAAFVSFDRGKSWKEVRVPTTPRGFPSIRSAGDPHVTATADGTFYFSFDNMNWGTTDKPLTNAGIGVSKSTDGGRTWSVPVLSGTPIDGPKITADLSTGTIYEASSSQLGPNSTGDSNTPRGKITDRWLVSSKDGIHWTKPQGMGGLGGSMSAAHGIFATAFKTSAQPGPFSSANNDLCGTAPKPCTIFQTTSDAGSAWSRHVVSAPNDYGSNPNVPMVAADPSRKGHFALAVPMKGSGGFLVYQTRDAGATWSEPVSVTEDPGRTHFHPWMAYSRQGMLGIMWRTRQPEPGKPAAPVVGFGEPAEPYNIWAAVSRDGGTTFSAPLKVSSADSPAPQAGPFGGSGDDYSGFAVDSNYVYVVWADWRSKERDDYFRAIRLDEFGPARK